MVYKRKQSAYRLIALILCVAMMLPVMSPLTVQVVSAATNSDAITINGYDGIISAEDNLSVDNAISKAGTTTTPRIEFNRVTKDVSLVQEGRYLLMSDLYGHIMSFDATAEAEISDKNSDQYGSSFAGSIKKNASGAVDTYYIANDKVYLDQSNRHLVIWNMRQYKEVTGGSTLANGSSLQITPWANFGLAAATDRNQGIIYQGIELQKRTNTYDSY